MILEIKNSGLLFQNFSYQVKPNFYSLCFNKWQQSGSRAQRYVPLFITIRPKENIKISKLLILLASNWDS